MVSNRFDNLWFSSYITSLFWTVSELSSTNQHNKGPYQDGGYYSRKEYRWIVKGLSIFLFFLSNLTGPGNNFQFLEYHELSIKKALNHPYQRHSWSDLRAGELWYVVYKSYHKYIHLIKSQVVWFECSTLNGILQNAEYNGMAEQQNSVYVHSTHSSSASLLRQVQYPEDRYSSNLLVWFNFVFRLIILCCGKPSYMTPSHWLLNVWLCETCARCILCACAVMFVPLS